MAGSSKTSRKDKKEKSNSKASEKTSSKKDDKRVVLPPVLAPIPTVDINLLEKRLKSLGYVITYKPFMIKNLEESLSTLARDILTFALRPPETKPVNLPKMDFSSSKPIETKKKSTSKKKKKPVSISSSSTESSESSSSESSEPPKKSKKKSSKKTTKRTKKESSSSSTESSESSSSKAKSSSSSSESSEPPKKSSAKKTNKKASSTESSSVSKSSSGSTLTESSSVSSSSEDSLESVSAASQDDSSEDDTAKTCKFELGDPFKFKKKDMDKDRNTLLDEMVKKYGPYPSITPKIMKQMYEYYDKHFFHGLLERQVKNRGHGIIFEVSNKATQIGGSAGLKKGEPIRVMLSRSIMEGVTKDKVEALKVNGLHIVNRVDAVMRVMEHELVHVALLTSETKEHIKEHHGALFKAIVKGVFGHKGTKHELSISKGLVGKKRIPREKLREGMFVAFSDKDRKDGKGRSIGYAKVTKINQTRCVIQTPTNTYTIPFDALYEAGDMPDKVKAAIEKKLKSQSKASDFRVGNKVKFTGKGGVIVKGKITKLNQVTAKVQPDDGGGVWTVGYPGLSLR